jgi:hypothetical protein
MAACLDPIVAQSPRAGHARDLRAGPHSAYALHPRRMYVCHRVVSEWWLIVSVFYTLLQAAVIMP